MDLPSTPKEALACGSVYYFTGKPCPRGHVSKRTASSATCVECDLMGKRDPDGFAKTRLRGPDGARAASIAEGRATYHGQPCKRCGGTERDVKFGGCASGRCRLDHIGKYYHGLSREEKDARNAKSRDWHNSRAAAGITRLEEQRAYYAKNKEKLAEYRAQWMKDNPERARETAYRRIARKKQAVPPWETDSMRECIRDMYRLAAIMSLKTPHEVDHIIPLSGKTVCGLHVPWNLWVIPAADNCSRPRNWQPCNLNNLEALAKNGLNDLPKILAYTG